VTERLVQNRRLESLPSGARRARLETTYAAVYDRTVIVTSPDAAVTRTANSSEPLRADLGQLGRHFQTRNLSSSRANSTSLPLVANTVPATGGTPIDRLFLCCHPVPPAYARPDALRRCRLQRQNA